jgi:ABC-type Fe3+/spermidine/putrescine transport system ATPase subunit
MHQDADTKTAIAIRHVTKSFRRPGGRGSVLALDDVSLDIAPNSFVSLVGPSGCGKTTLLRLLNGLQPGEGLVAESCLRSLQLLRGPPRRGA